jgi:hypothetical protein
MGVKPCPHPKEEHDLRMFEREVLRRKFGPRGEEGRGNGENFVMKSFIVRTRHQMLLG